MFKFNGRRLEPLGILLIYLGVLSNHQLNHLFPTTLEWCKMMTAPETIESIELVHNYTSWTK